jgi:glycosyltransferase involved in cell wall biosynthesis
MKPVLFVTGHVPAYRAGALARLHELEGIEVALFGGREMHGGSAFTGALPVPHRPVRQRELYALAAGAGHRAVICSTAGRLAPLAAWAGARRARVPLIVWSSLWAHPRTLVHALSYLPLSRLYRGADAVVTYGPHVSAYVAARGARNVHVAPQSVDNDFWRSPDIAPPRGQWPPTAGTTFLFVGRAVREKGAEVLLAAWREGGLRPPQAALVLAGIARGRMREAHGRYAQLGVWFLEPVPAVELRNIYAASDVLVVPSIPTRTFREPWGLVANEAMNRGLPVIASDAVGAAAGGLVRDGRNGLVVPAGDAAALARAMARLAGDHGERVRFGAAAAQDVLAYSHDAWARGFSRALATLGVSRGHC